MPALADPSNAYNPQHTYVIQSLSEVKSIVLLADVQDWERLTTQLFSSFFDIMSGSSTNSSAEQVAKGVVMAMTSILITMVDETQILPSEVIDIIVAQFLRADPRALNASDSKKNGTVDDKQSTFRILELPQAYNMAKSICNLCPEKMARYISQYFNDVIMDASNADGAKNRRGNADDDSDDDEGPSGPTEEDMKELRKAHRLLRELWRAAPPVLQNVIPQLEAELLAENVGIRLLATEALGDMISGIGAAGPPIIPVMDPAAYPPYSMSSPPDVSASNDILTIPSSPVPFQSTHPAAYISFIGRSNDKSALVRASWTTCIGRILLTSAGGVGLGRDDQLSLVTKLAAKLLDGDERVRIAAVKVIGSFGLKDVVGKLGAIGGVTKEGSVLYNLAERSRDRKHSVRQEAMTVFGRLWGVAAGEISQGNETVISLIGPIPTRVYDAFYANDKEINVLLDHVTFELLLPLGFPPTKPKKANPSKGKEKAADIEEGDRLRVERLLQLVKGLEGKARKAFYAVPGRQVRYAQVMSGYLKACEDYNGGVMDKDEAEIKAKLTAMISWFAQLLPDPVKVTADLWKFAKMHDRRNYQLVRFTMAPESDYKTVHKAFKELVKRINDAPGSPQILDTLTPLLYRVGLFIYNKSHVPVLVNYSRNDESDHGLGGTAHEILKEISSSFPAVFKAHVKELCALLQEHVPTASKLNDTGAVDTLSACAGFARKFPKDMPQDRKLMESLSSFAKYGTPPAAAKHAVTILISTAEKKEMYATDLVKYSLKGFKFGQGHFLTKLATLSQILLLAPEAAEDQGGEIVDIAIKDILLKVREPASDSDADWIDDDGIDDECKAKVLALKVLCNRLRANVATATTNKDLAMQVFKILNRVVSAEGELSKAKDTPPAHKSRLRLAAAQFLLQLCRMRQYDDMLTPSDFNLLACVSQDPVVQVRHAFITKLKKYLGANQLPSRFYAITFLTAFEPTLEMKESTTTWLRSRANYFAQAKLTTLEQSFSRLLSLLAHHPDFSKDPDDLADFARYIVFYLQTVANEDNLSLIYYVAQRVKQTRDGIKPANSDNLYYLSDLAQAVIRSFEDFHGWSMQTFPGKVRLPAGLFTHLPDHETAQEIAGKVYLPEGVTEKINVLVRARTKSKKVSY
jgi:sister chromatid cohesion protein PDS5